MSWEITAAKGQFDMRENVTLATLFIWASGLDQRQSRFSARMFLALPLLSSPSQLRFCAKEVAENVQSWHLHHATAALDECVSSTR